MSVGISRYKILVGLVYLFPVEHIRKCSDDLFHVKTSAAHTSALGGYGSSPRTVDSREKQSVQVISRPMYSSLP
jgi:hypothetical protein